MAPNIQDTEILEQYATFIIADRLCGIDVTKVQEVVRPITMTKIPLAASFIRGLINLRGQVATAIGLRELFGLGSDHREPMNVVCQLDGDLVSLLVDEIGDVIEVSRATYEAAPATIPKNLGAYIAGVYKLKDGLLSVIDIEHLFKTVNT